MTSKDFSFADFAQENFYEKLNARLIEMIDIGSRQRIIDLACGTGAIIKLVLNKLKNTGTSVVVGVDQSASALRQAMKDLRGFKNASLEFVQIGAERFSEAVKGSADTIIFCNAIHYIKDKNKLMKEVKKVLRPDGVFAFNTSFFRGGQPTESRQFYGRWMLKSLKYLKRTYELFPIKSEKVEARKQLAPEEYEELLTKHGLRIRRREIHTVHMPLNGWLSISKFKDFIDGVMPGVPLDKGSDSLQKGAIETFKELGIESVPRNWLYVIAWRT
ncbi:MAG: class I SAM-dependent methyltransferase [Candidatus Neomarinimicrobiota bacterium]